MREPTQKGFTIICVYHAFKQARIVLVNNEHIARKCERKCAAM